MCGVELVPVERLKPADYNPRRAAEFAEEWDAVFAYADARPR